MDAELVRRGLATSRGDAVRMITEGRVVIAGSPVPKPSSMVSPDTPIRVEGESPRYVSRGGLKMEAALEAFPVSVEGRSAIDVGASTGGFTDCLLQHGAASVVALDVGYGQLDWSLRTDERVTIVERTNVRYVDPDEVGAPFDVVVADLSFISLATVAEALIGLGAPETDYLLLIKPQFEAGPDAVGKGGVIRDAGVRRQAVEATIEALGRAGLGALDVVASPIEGAKSGNREVIAWFRLGPATVQADRVVEATG